MDNHTRNLYALAFTALIIAVGAIGYQMQVQGGLAYNTIPAPQPIRPGPIPPTTEPVGPPTQPPIIGVFPTCSDTDGGYVPKVAGTVSGWQNNQQYAYADSCSGGATLVEWYCSNQAAPLWSNFNCAGNSTTKCQNGACI